MFLSTDEEWLGARRGRDIGMSAVVGNPGEVTDIIGAYAKAGADEFIVPGFTLGDGSRRAETCDLFIEQIAPAFR